MVRGVLGVAGFLAIAEVATRTGLVDPEIVPPASHALARAAELPVNAEFLTDVGATLVSWSVGLAIAVVVGVLAGVILGSLPALDAAMRLIVEFLRPLPSIAILPLVILLLSSDLGVKVTIIIYASVWPVLINTVYGLKEVDPLAKETLRSFGFGHVAVMRLVSLPSAAPFVLTGIRLASSIALILSISVELLTGGTRGIGVFIFHASGVPNNIDMVLGATIWAGVLGFAANAAFVRFERWALHGQTARIEALT